MVDVSGSLLQRVGWRQILVAISKACSWSVACFSCLLLSVRILRFFLIATLNAALPLQVWGRIYDDALWLKVDIVVSMLTASLVFCFAIHNARKAGLGFQGIWLPLPTIALFIPAALSYRSFGMVFTCLALMAYFRLVKRRTGAVALVVLCMLLVAVSALPIDVTLQNLPGGPRIVAVISGLNDADPCEAVIIGGCLREYIYPKWVVVW
jgi:hypothetical protein